MHNLVWHDGRPNYLGLRHPVPTKLNIVAWERHLCNYGDWQIINFLKIGWPVNYSKQKLPNSYPKNDPSAIQYPNTIREFVQTELQKRGIAGPFVCNPLDSELIISPLMTVPKYRSDKRRVVHDLSFSHGQSENAGIEINSYLGQPFVLRLPGVDRLIDMIRLKGKSCLLFKLDLSRAYRQILVDPLDLLGFTFDDSIYFHTCLVFGQHSVVLACQCIT